MTSTLVLPDPSLHENWRDAFGALVTQLQQQVDQGGVDLPIQDGAGRNIVTSDGVVVHDGAGGTPINGTIVSIDTQHLVDAAVDLNKLADDSIDENKLRVGAITANKAVIGDSAILTAMIGDAQIVNAKIADATIQDAKVNDLSVAKLTAGVISASGVYVGADQAIVLDGSTNTVEVKDGSANTLFRIGRFGVGDYGTKLFDSGGNVLVSATNSSTEINADFITTGGMKVDRLEGGTITANAIYLGADQGIELDGSANRIRVFDGNSNLRTQVGRQGTGVYGFRVLAANGTPIIQADDNGTYIDATYMTTGTLDASVVNVTNLDASEITTGSLEADFISGGTLQLTTGMTITTDAGVTAISSTGINADTINAGTLSAVVVDASAITTGILDFEAINRSALQVIASELGTDSVSNDAIQTGAVQADNISVTTLSAIQADLGAITAGSLDAVTITSATLTSGTIDGVTITGSTLQTGPSGDPRVVISQDYIQIWSQGDSDSALEIVAQFNTGVASDHVLEMEAERNKPLLRVEQNELSGFSDGGSGGGSNAIYAESNTQDAATIHADHTWGSPSVAFRAKRGDFRTEDGNFVTPVGYTDSISYKVDGTDALYVNGSNELVLAGGNFSQVVLNSSINVHGHIQTRAVTTPIDPPWDESFIYQDSVGNLVFKVNNNGTVKTILLADFAAN